MNVPLVLAAALCLPAAPIAVILGSTIWARGGGEGR